MSRDRRAKDEDESEIAGRPQRPWRPQRQNVKALDRWIRDTYGAEAPRYGTA